MDRPLFRLGAIAGGLGVAFGAFGAHALRDRLSPEMLAVFDTGVRYQLYHALALVATALVKPRLESRLVSAAGWLFALGIVLFSGSLYVLALTGIGVFGAVTPLGGVAFIVAWAFLAIASI